MHSVSCQLPRNVRYKQFFLQKKPWICLTQLLSIISLLSIVDWEKRWGTKKTFYFCVMWKLINGNFTQVEARRGRSHAAPLVSYRNICQWQAPREESSTGKASRPVPQRSRSTSTVHPDTSANENQSSSYFSPMDFFENNPSQLPLFFYKKKVPILCFLDLLMAFARVCLSQIAIPLLCLNKPTFTSKITGWFLRWISKRNSGSHFLDWILINFCVTVNEFTKMLFLIQTILRYKNEEPF